MQEALAGGAAQTVHVLVPTCGEPAAVVRECLVRLLVAPEPVYMEKVLHVCDGGGGNGGGVCGDGDAGAAGSPAAAEDVQAESRRMEAMVEQLRQLGASPPNASA